MPKPHPVDYPVANFGVDADIATTQANQAYSEGKLKKANWNPQPFLNDNLQVNTEESSDDSSDSDDENVQLSMEREPLLAWKPKDPKFPKLNYFVPNFGNDSNVQTTLDNAKLAEKITGHTWTYIDPKDRPKPEKKDYFVPNFGVDSDVSSVA